LKRVGGFDGVTQGMLLAPMFLRESDLGPLFELLVNDSIYACDDTDADPRLNTLRLAHLLPDDIRASITAPVSINGHVVGIVSCTQRGTTRRWTQREVAAMRRIADEIALRHIRRMRVSAEASLLADGAAEPATRFSGTRSGALMPREEERSGD
jgi:GAF domain-containing protein